MLRKELLDSRASIEARDNFGITPLHDAGSYGIPKTVKMLVNAGANINVKSDFLFPNRDGCFFRAQVRNLRKILKFL